jgi:hypothetical protein
VRIDRDLAIGIITKATFTDNVGFFRKPRFAAAMKLRRSVAPRPIF